MQHERVQDHYPWTWEVPVGFVGGLALTVVLGWQVARSAVNWLAGAGWVWPAWSQLFGSLPGLLAGDAASGLVSVHHIAPPALLWAAMAAFTALILAVGFGSAIWAWRRWGSGAMRGMAPVAEARQLLGADRLHRVRHVVRPDLYPVRQGRTR